MSVNPEVIIPANAKGKLDVSGAVGNGFLQVIKDMGLKEPYVGQVASADWRDRGGSDLLFCSK